VTAEPLPTGLLLDAEMSGRRNIGARAGALGKWRKLRGRSLAELRVRTTQALAAWSERLNLSSQVCVPDDRAFAHRLTCESARSRALGADLLERFRARTSPRFFAAFGEQAEVVTTLRRRWPHLEGRVLDAAERVHYGRFDLLGRSGLECGVPIDWHRDPLSGRRPGQAHWSAIDFLNPDVAGEYKLVWELNRHQYFSTLGKAYWYTGDERYAATFVEHLMGWMDANPPKDGINWASSLEVAFRLISWIWGLYFFKSSPRLTAPVFLRTLKLLDLHGRHIETYLSTYSSPNTHLTGEALGLLYLGSLFPELRDAARWRTVGWGILVEQLEKHVRTDGSYFEQSTYYHRYTADFCLHLSILGHLNGLPVEAAIHPRLQALLDHLMYLTQGDGRTPLLGDDDGGRLVVLDDRAPDDFRAALATGAALFGRADYRYVAEEAAEETVWLLGLAGLRAFDALPPAPPATTSRAFVDGGYYVMRDAWGRAASTLLIDCGPHGVLNCGHAHADALGITLAVHGSPVLVDPGTYTYTATRQLRDHFRSAQAHNTVTVAGESSSVPAGPFSWRHVAHSSPLAWRTGERCDYFEGEHDGYTRLSPPALHRRAVLFLRGDYWVVRDRILTAGDHDVELHLQFAPGVSVETMLPSRLVAEWGPHGRPEALEMAVFGHDGVIHARGGWVSSSYGELISARTCAFTARAGRPGRYELVSFFVPREVGSTVTIDIAERLAAKGRAFVIGRSGGEGIEDVLLMGEAERGEAAIGDWCSDAEWAWVRRASAGERPSEIVMLNGGRLRWRDRPLVVADAPIRYLAARRHGVELHVEVETTGRCEIDLLGAERLVVTPASVGTVDVARRHASAPVGVT
jgi:Heparinase II/III-like protein/Heparinase II/III N-terminus